MPEGSSSASSERRLRQDARALFDAAVAAVDPVALVEEELRQRPLEADPGGRIVTIAVGKAALAMAEGARRILGDRIAHGLALRPSGTGVASPAWLETYQGGHPLPDQGGVEGARALREAAKQAGPADRLLVLLSGGGSALLTLPAGEVSLEDVRTLTGLLLRAGAPIQELNTVRKHLDALKGGGLARIAAPTPVRALLLSDVVGDPPDVIASGPLSPDPTTFADAITVLERRDVWNRAPETVRQHLLRGKEGLIPETPKPGDPLLAGVETTVVGNAARAVAGAAARAHELGYRTHIHSVTLTGEARCVGEELARLGREIRSDPVAPPTALLAAGETTVHVRGSGLGGRNQEVALGAAVDLDGLEDVLVMGAGTDGVDGPTDAAGAVATGTTLRRARVHGLDACDALDRNDSYRFFEVLGDLVKTGPTGTNVMDLMVVLVGRNVPVRDT